MATQEQTAAPATEWAGTQTRQDLRTGTAGKLDKRLRVIAWALAAALTLAAWALVGVGLSLIF